MKQVIIKSGKIITTDVPEPTVTNNSVLIKVVYSCISAGTEISSLRSSKKSLITKALHDSNNVSKILDMLKSIGIESTLEVVKKKISFEKKAKEDGRPIGYSISGIVLEVGSNVTGFQVGDRVAAAGAGIANHAEFVVVPENLVMKIPGKLGFESASTVTMGGIALQGVRRANMNLGEFCVVIGAGILGLLSIQLLRISGTRVIAIDYDQRRLDLAFEMGAELVINASTENTVSIVEGATNGYGSDAVIFTAATNDPDSISNAFQMCKRKGRVIMVGVAGNEIRRSDMYEKELDLMLSTSYGPGRYDRNYEEKNLDYPYAYVRWTENRNMSEYLRLLSENTISLDKMIESKVKVENADYAFSLLSQKENKPLMVLLGYEVVEESQAQTHNKRTTMVLGNSIKANDEIQIAVIGLGNFSTSVHLPNLNKLPGRFHLRAVCDNVGLKAKNVGLRYNVDYVTTDFEQIIQDDKMDAILIATRHDNHAELVLKALQAGKNVFVEKPLAINSPQLQSIEAFFQAIPETPLPFLMVGFNRRYSHYMRAIKAQASKRVNPLFINYRMNAGFIPSDAWPHESGGRIIGEGCHLIDLMNYLVGSSAKSIGVNSLRPNTDMYSMHDNKSIVIKYSDGSVACINYFSVGSNTLSKEYMELHFDGKSIVVDDYKTVIGHGIKLDVNPAKVGDKGHLHELERFYDFVSNGHPHYAEFLKGLFETTSMSFQIADFNENN